MNVSLTERVLVLSSSAHALFPIVRMPDFALALGVSEDELSDSLDISYRGAEMDGVLILRWLHGFSGAEAKSHWLQLAEALRPIASARLLQAAWRGFVVRRWLRGWACAHGAAVMIQAAFHGHRARSWLRSWTRAHAAAALVQTAWAGRIARRGRGRATTSKVAAFAATSAQAEGWLTATDELGRAYFYHSETQEVRWQAPRGEARVARPTAPIADSAGGGSHLASLAAGWLRATDELGRGYYYHEESGEARWEAPPLTDVDAAAPSVLAAPLALALAGMQLVEATAIAAARRRESAATVRLAREHAQLAAILIEWARCALLPATCGAATAALRLALLRGAVARLRHACSSRQHAALAVHATLLRWRRAAEYRAFRWLQRAATACAVHRRAWARAARWRSVHAQRLLLQRGWGGCRRLLLPLRARAHARRAALARRLRRWVRRARWRQACADMQGTVALLARAAALRRWRHRAAWWSQAHGALVLGVRVYAHRRLGAWARAAAAGARLDEARAAASALRPRRQLARWRLEAARRADAAELVERAGAHHRLASLHRLLRRLLDWPPLPPSPLRVCVYMRSDVRIFVARWRDELAAWRGVRRRIVLGRALSRRSGMRRALLGLWWGSMVQAAAGRAAGRAAARRHALFSAGTKSPQRLYRDFHLRPELLRSHLNNQPARELRTARRPAPCARRGLRAPAPLAFELKTVPAAPSARARREREARRAGDLEALATRAMQRQERIRQRSWSPFVFSVDGIDEPVQLKVTVGAGF